MKTGTMKRTIFASTLAFLALANLSACKCGSNEQSTAIIKLEYPKGETLAQVGGVNLTVEELGKEFVARQGSFAGADNLNTEPKRKEFVESQVMQEAMFQEANALGYFNNPEVLRGIKKLAVQKLMQDKLEEVQTNYVPTAEEIQEHYNSNLNLYKREEAVSVSYILVPFGDKKEASKVMAADMHKNAQEMVKNANKKDFGGIAMEYMKKAGAKAPVKVEFNQTSYLEKEAFEAKFGPNTFAAVKDLPNTGDIAPLVTGASGYLVLMKNGYRKQMDETVAQAEDKIKKRLAYKNRGKAYEDYLAILRKKYNIKIFDEKIAGLGKNALPAIKPKENVANNN